MDKSEIRDFFNRCAADWDAQLHCDNGKMNIILDAAGVTEGKRILDIACGTGVMFPYYLERGVSSITGVDLAEEMLKKAREKFGGNEIIRLVCADAEATAFTGAYDCCMVFNAFPHFGNPKGLLKNLYKALKPGGSLTVAHDWGRAALDAHHQSEASEVSCGLMPEDALARLFGQCGFENIVIRADEGIYIVFGTKG